MTTLDRRLFLRAGAASAGGLALAGPFSAFAARAAHAEPTTSEGYGPISPKPDMRDGVTRLALPDGFTYTSFGLAGSTMSDGRPTPAAHDGMAAFVLAKDNGKIRLVRNHEARTPGPAFVPAQNAYDSATGSGGTTTLIFNPATFSLDRDFASLGGTIVNCAGGTTPAGTWLTCEETTQTQTQPHGYIFEVPASADAPVTSVPFKAMGRFSHEAIAIDPRTGFVYETEDAGGNSGLYRFRPTATGDYAQGGTLEMAVVNDTPNYQTATGQTVGTRLPVSWVTIDNPDQLSPSTFQQGATKGGASWRRLEGAWWDATENTVFFNATDGGEASAGQVWGLTPTVASGGSDQVFLAYQSPGTDTLLKPDNITVSPGGAVFLFEDPDRARQAFIRGLTPDGQLFTFGSNIRPEAEGGPNDEFAGGTFSPDGNILFVNIQTMGITFAITGPFRNTGPGGGGPAPVIPEVPSAALLPAAALGIAGAAVAMRNRRAGEPEPGH